MSKPSDEERAASSVRPLGAGRYLIDLGSRHQEAFAARAGTETWVFIDGRVHVFVEERPGRRPSAGSDDTLLAAPMPASVLRVDVSAGQRVQRGDVLLVLEAMKIELPIKSPRDGMVRDVKCRPGELVQPGIPLVDIEYDESPSRSS